MRAKVSALAASGANHPPRRQGDSRYTYDQGAALVRGDAKTPRTVDIFRRLCRDDAVDSDVRLCRATMQQTHHAFKRSITTTQR